MIDLDLTSAGPSYRRTEKLTRKKTPWKRNPQRRTRKRSTLAASPGAATPPLQQLNAGIENAPGPIKTLQKHASTSRRNNEYYQSKRARTWRSQPKVSAAQRGNTEVRSKRHQTGRLFTRRDDSGTIRQP